MERPTLNADNAVSQAGWTIGRYLNQAIDEIDRCFGEGFAKKHPALVAECVRSQTMDFNTTSLVSAIWAISDAIPSEVRLNPDT